MDAGSPTSALDKLFADSGARVIQVASAAREALEPDDPCRHNEAISSCTCTYSPCGSRFADSLACSPDFGANMLTCGGSACKAAKIDYEHSFVHVGRGLLQDDGSASSAIAKDICVTKSMDRSVFRSLKSARQFTYFATSNGVFRVHPGRPSIVNDALGKCTQWEPRLRPWYSEASSGPKDVVIAVDASAQMAGTISNSGSSTRWSLASSVFDDVLDTLNTRDFVAVVRTDDSANGVVTVGNQGSLLMPATDEHKKTLHEAMEKVKPSGPLNVVATMRAAFGLLRRSAEESGGGSGRASAGCSRVVIWITGGEDACYSSPACKAGAAAGACTCTQDVLTELRTRQAELSAVGPGELPQAMVATMTVGDHVDDSLARQMACSSSGGVWARVTSFDLSGRDRASATDLTGYYRLLSAARWSPPAQTQVVFSRLYEGEGALGLMTTATVPIFSKYSKRVLGVAGADIPISRITDAAPTSTLESIKAEVAKRAPSCTEGGDLTKLVKPCEIQQLRGLPAACVPARPPSAVRCFRRGSTGTDLYVSLPETSEWRSFDQANAYCGALGPDGTLAPVTSNLLNELLTPLSGVDGSWVGVRRGMNASSAGEWVTPKGASVVYSSWTVAPRLEDCVAIDRRGLRNNWTARKCGALLPFICLVPNVATTPLSVCGAGGVVDLEAKPENRSDPLFATGECSINQGRPSCDQQPSPIDNKPLCPVDLATGGNSCDNTCCDGCECIAVNASAGSGISTGAVVGIVVGVLILVVVAIGSYWLWRRKRDIRRIVEDASESGDEYFVMRRSDEQFGKDFGSGPDDGVPPGAGVGAHRDGERGGRENESDAETVNRGRQEEHATEQGGAFGTRVWSWSPGTFFSPRRAS
ncbi:hypothetical protein MMPV_001621 [Pyropia vietnamensis]